LLAEIPDEPCPIGSVSVRVVASTISPTTSRIEGVKMLAKQIFSSQMLAIPFSSKIAVSKER
jgi:hypothetical protein